MEYKKKISEHINKNRWQYFVIILIFVLGVITGDYKALALEGSVKNHLLNLIDIYLRDGVKANGISDAIFVNAFLNQVKSIIVIWFLGLTVIGIPLILVIIFVKGFSLGFTIGFLIQEKAGHGILIGILSILPQNIVYIPFLIIWSVIAINFSVYILRRRQDNTISFGAGLISYSMLMLIFLLFFLVGAFIEAYLSPWFLGLFM